MNTTNNTILITGGGSGIGFEMAKLLSEKGNQVIIIGRTKSKLDKAAAQLKNVTAIAADITKEKDITDLAERLKKEFPNLNGIINNAASAYLYALDVETNAFDKAQDEMLTNYLSVIRLTSTLLPALRTQAEAFIINVSSIVAFVPGHKLPTYSASKAALHSYTQTLRLSLSHTSVKVFELMPPLVDTEFSKEVGGSNGIKPSVVAEDLLKALDANQYEIRVGMTEAMYQLSLSSPEEAFNAMNEQTQKA
ncbi:MAG: SDR family NAD(P)-dependent oxidoreductase [Cytophagales bacterium]|nr:SDR family NAD(P)-dependent oxidoreductase [Cytophaga sp.]